VSRPIILTGGGTGGHVFPLRAIAEALVAAGVPRDDLVVVGSRRGQEGTLLADLGCELVLLPGRGLRRDLSPRAVAQNLVAAVGLVAAALRGIALVARRRPRAVVSVGGYAAFAASLGAVLTGRPLVLVDLDATPGLVHRTLGRFAVAITSGLPTDGDARSVVTGVPVRAEILAAERSAAARSHARARLGLPADGPVVAVATGSLGAGSVNAAVGELAARWRQHPTATLYHVTGRRDADAVRAARAALGDPATWRVVDFEADMAALWVACDVAVCRAGATTVAELCVTGTPALLVPLPGAPGAHQDANAAVLARGGAAVVIDDAEVSGAALDDALTSLLDDPDRLAAMSAAASSLARRDAAARVASVVLDRAR